MRPPGFEPGQRAREVSGYPAIKEFLDIVAIEYYAIGDDCPDKDFDYIIILGDEAEKRWGVME